MKTKPARKKVFAAMMTKHYRAAALLSALACTTTTLVAQDAANAVAVTTPAEIPAPPPYRPWTVGIGAGTDGIYGAGVSWRFSDHLGARTGFGYAEASFDHVAIRGLEYNISLRLLDEPLALDVYPWRKRSFRISVGLLLNQNELSGTVSSTGTIIVNGQPVVIPAGSLTMKLKQQPVDPYLGFGGNLFYFDRPHRWALAGELGVAYTGNSRVSVDRSNGSSLPDDVVDEVKSRLKHYANQFQLWPVAKLAVTYSF